MITIKQSEGSSRQFSLLYIPKDISKWDEQYISLSGYCGEYGPHVFAAAPEFLEALELLLPFSPSTIAEPCQYVLGCWENAANAVKKAKNITP
jgi:hypothetical protein